MTHDEELIERVAKATWDEMALRHAWQMTWEQARQYPIHRNAEWSRAALAIDTVRTYDREQRAKIDAAIAPVSNPDDYRDLPLSMTADVRFKGGLTEGKP